MRIFRLFVLLLLIPATVYTQNSPQGTYGNEWYLNAVPGQVFVKLLVVKKGVYRVTASDLAMAGYDLSTVSPDEIKLYYRGNEQPLHVAETPGGMVDYVEFVGFKNDGRVDSLMYKDPLTGIHASDLQPNIDISLFSDTAAYFLTWSPSSGKRYHTFVDLAYSQYTPEPTFPFEAVGIFEPGDSLTEYALGGGGSFDVFYTLNSDYGPGEGYVGPAFTDSLPFVFPLLTPGAMIGPTDSVRFRTRIFGRSNTSHAVRAMLNGTPVLNATSFTGISIQEFEEAHVGLGVSDTSMFTFESVANNADLNHLCKVSLRYPRRPDLLGDSTLNLTDWANSNPVYLAILATAGNDSVWIYDLTLGQRIAGVMSGDTAHVIVPAHSSKRELIMLTDRAIRKPIISVPAFANLSDPNSGASFIIITHPELQASAQAYASYRDTNQVNSFSTEVVSVEEIYDEFGYGSPTPWAIKRFLNYALESRTVKPEYVLFWGQARFRTREFSGAMVPTFGYPNTDWEFASPILPDSVDVKPRLAVGRVNILHDLEGEAYLDKIRAYETLPWQDWMRRALFLASPGNASEYDIFVDLLDSLAVVLQQDSVPWLINRLPSSFPYNLAADTVELQARLDTGASLVHMLGFGQQLPNGLQVGEAYDYQNWGKPPFVIGQFAYGTSLSEQGINSRWLVEPGRGAIAYLGNSCATYFTPLAMYNRRLYDIWQQDTSGAPIGQIISRTFTDVVDTYTGKIFSSLSLQMSLQGDPALRLYPSTFSFGDVWPGDANADGTADMTDLLAIGLAYGDSGYIRPDASLDWIAQPSPDWPQVFPDSVNFKHADTNGDSLINAADTIAVQLNYGLTSNKTEDSNFIPGGLPLSLVYPAVALEGDTIHIAVELGDSLQVADSIYGVAFTMQYDLNLVADSSVRVIFDPSWLGTNGADALALFHDRPLDGEVDIAITRTDHLPVSGYGKIADVSIVITDDLAKKAWDNWMEPALTFGFSHNEKGEEIALDNPAPEVYIPPAQGDAWVYPNPAYNRLFLNPKGEKLTHVKLVDLSGRILLELAEVKGRPQEIALPDLSPGLYLLQFNVGSVQKAIKVSVVR